MSSLGSPLISRGFRGKLFSELVNKPFYGLLFLYFLTISMDLLNVNVLIFKVKFTNAISIIMFFLYIILFRKIKLDRSYLGIACFCLLSLITSSIFSLNRFACNSFILFFIFNYLVYFSFPIQFFSNGRHSQFLNLYFISFVWVGIYVSAQVFLSCVGILLPFPGQRLAGIVRGQGFSYEPSYYALYMTPYAIFRTTQFLLQKKKERKTKDLIWPNFFLLVSTSTGCFFSYCCFIFFFALFKFRNKWTLILKFILNFFLGSAVVCFLFWVIFPEIIASGFLKFFYSGFKNHHSFLERWAMIEKYWEVFLQNPWLGTGLGGATAFISLKEDGYIDFSDPLLLTKPGLIATNVTSEILGSLGILGTLAFSSFLILVLKTFKDSFKIQELNEEEKIYLTAFAMTLLVTFFTLQFNGSIMRSYLWLHFAISIGYAKFLKLKYRKFI